ncbi:MAG: class I tRNA ligase family protein, partial [Dethiobacter sp.]|nr:class I tRNA ligase family protein [Dethiobacter sp.]
GEPPYRGVLSHGWVVDGEGRKMSKSLGNVIAPEEIIKQYGADILRLWVSSADFTSDIHLSADILRQLTEVYRKIRNTCRFLLGNCFDFDPTQQSIRYEALAELDRWALCRLDNLVRRVTRAYEEYEFHIVFHALHNFCVVDLSSFYLDILKDTLYCEKADSPARRSAQTVMWLIMETITKLMAPILTFTADELWQLLPGKRPASIQVCDWPVPDPQWNDRDLGRRWEILLEVREEVTRALEQARKEKIIGGSLEASVSLWAGGDLYPLLKEYHLFLSALFIASNAELFPDMGELPAGAVPGQKLNLKIQVTRAPGGKCPRCWIFSEREEELCSRCAAVIR